MGISPENLPRIFEPYFTTKGTGSGLGLTTVFSIVSKHQGHIEVESKVGRGTIFNIWLPACESPPEPALPSKTPDAGAPAGPELTGRILFMDDEAQIRQMTTAMLKRMGHEVTAVDDGSAAVIEYSAAREAGRPYDVVILDLTVPGGMGGAKAMERLRQMDPAVCAIVSSGYSNDPVMANYRSHGFHAIVPKPYEIRVLADAISALLRERRR
jgi:CheY-like chemotaxis protein